jgi:hypothetical protein
MRGERSSSSSSLEHPRGILLGQFAAPNFFMNLLDFLRRLEKSRSHFLPTQMKTTLQLLILAGAICNLQAATTINDSTGDIDPGIATGSGTLDIVSMEVSNTATDIQFKMTVNGNVSTTDWGKFMIGISTGGPGSTSSNAWGRPIGMTSPIGGMDYWIGSWVDGGSGSQLWSSDGSAWAGPASLGGFSLSSGGTSEITYTTSLSSLGLSMGDTFYFDAYSSAGGAGDTAIDALSNPNVSVTSWGGIYTSNATNGISSYTLVPEPSSCLLVAGGLLAMSLSRRRR